MLLATPKHITDKFPLLASFQQNAWQATAHYYASCHNTTTMAEVERRLNITANQAHSLNIGFADRSLGNQLPSQDSTAGRTIRHTLKTLGIYKDNGRETLRGYITIPLVDEAGNITGLEGLKLDPHCKNQDCIIIGSGIRITECMQRCAQNIAIAVARQQAEQQEQPQPESPPNTAQCESTTPHQSPNQRESPTLPTSESPRKSTACQVVVTGNQVTIARDDRTYQVRGLAKNMSSLTLKVNITAARLDLLHLDTVDLLKAQSRAAFIKAAATELLIDPEIIKKDLGYLLLHLEDLRNQQIAAAKAPTQKQQRLTQQEHQQAIELLRDPNLTSRIIGDLDRCGLVGEAFNKLAAYIAVVSRKLSAPLAILVQSSSSAGKTTLMDGILSLLPDDDYLRLSNLTAQSLYYLESSSLSHKTLAISEDHGINQVAYSLKLLQSEGKLTQATVTRDSDGNTRTVMHTVKGPVQLLLTSTSQLIDEELQNRCLILTVDETIEQTRSIQHQQRLTHTRQGIAQCQQADSVKALHRNAQSLLRPLKVYIPFAERLTFASDRTRLRRDNAKYLTLIQAIALLHQYQRTVTINQHGEESIDVQPSDVALANRLMKEILGQSLDELSPQTRRCLQLLETFVTAGCKQQSVIRADFRFTRRQFRQAIGWTDFQVRTHLDRLVELEYVTVHYGQRGRSYVYELAWDGSGADGQPFVVGLCDPESLTSLCSQQTAL